MLGVIFDEEVERGIAYYCSEDGASDLIFLDPKELREALENAPSGRILAGTPEDAQKAADFLLTTFNAKLTDIVRLQGKESRVFIGSRLEEAKKELDKTEEALVDFKSKNQTVSISEQTRTFVERQANLRRLAVDNQLALEKAWAQVRSPALITDTPTITNYKSRLADQEAELAALLKNHTEKHPKVKTLQAAMAETKAKLNEELKRVAQGELALGQTQRATIARLSSQEEQEMAMLPAKEQGLARLMLNYSVAQELYVMLAKRYEDARISEVMQPTNVQVVDVAALPEKTARPRWLLNFAIAGLLGMFFGLSSAFIADYFYKTIDTAEDVKNYLGLRVIGTIPVIACKRNRGKLGTVFRTEFHKLLNPPKQKVRRDDRGKTNSIYHPGPRTICSCRSFSCAEYDTAGESGGKRCENDFVYECYQRRERFNGRREYGRDSSL